MISDDTSSTYVLGTMMMTLTYPRLACNASMRALAHEQRWHREPRRTAPARSGFESHSKKSSCRGNLHIAPPESVCFDWLISQEVSPQKENLPRGYLCENPTFVILVLAHIVTLVLNKILVLKKFKISSLKFQKNLDVNNVVIRHRVKFQLEIPYIAGCTKITKSDSVQPTI
jgi:hypothetical protein